MLGEALLFHGVLLPRMIGVFGRWAWLANAVVFGLYPVHMFWSLPMSQVVRTIKLDAKATMLSLIQQSLCAIESIGSSQLEDDTGLMALRNLRDEFLVSTAAGREWVTLFERTQFAVWSLAMRDTQLMDDLGELVKIGGSSAG